MKRYKLIACKVMYREISYLSYSSESVIDTTYLRQDYHNTPEILNRKIQNEIDKLDKSLDDYSYSENNEQQFDAILIGYGLCSNAVVELKSSKHTLVVPKAHDCITLFLGSKEHYQEYFDKHSGGIYWYTAGWIENALLPGKERIDSIRQQYVENFGEDNADFLMEMEQDWLKKYKMCTFVEWPELPSQKHLDHTLECAKYLDWNFDKLTGSNDLLKRFVEGNWNEEDFLVVPPGHKIVASFDKSILKAVPCEE